MDTEEIRRASKMFRLVIADGDFDAAAALHLAMAPSAVIAIARESRQLLDATKEIRPHVVLLDANLPGPYGLDELMSRAKREYAAECVVLCADDFDDAQRRHWQGLGAAAVFPHPTKNHPRISQLCQIAWRLCMGSPLYREAGGA